jgi:uncharacterized protein YoxC
MTADIRNIAFACLAIALAGCAVLLTHDVHSLTGAAHGTLNNVNAATGTLADYARDESTLLRSPKNQAALDAAVQLGGVFNGSGRLLNTQVIPRAMKTLDGLTAETASLKTLTDTLNIRSATLLDSANTSVTALTRFINNTGAGTTTLLANGSVMVTDLDAKTTKLVNDFDVLTVGPDGLQGLVAKGNTSVTEINGSLHNVNLMTADLQKEVHKLFNPPPCVGFKCHLLVVLTQLKNVAAAAFLVERIYFGLP